MENSLIPMALPVDEEIIEIKPRSLVKSSGTNIEIYKSRSLIKPIKKKLEFFGTSYEMTAEELCRMIKNVTQTIGEYKGQKNPYSHIIVGALRKARRDLVTTLETEFRISYYIGDEGQSIFQEL